MQDFTVEELRLIVTLSNDRYHEYLAAANGKETENSQLADGICKKAMALIRAAGEKPARRGRPPLAPSRTQEGLLDG